MTFAEAFEKTVETGRSIRRTCWDATRSIVAYQRTLGEWRLICSPEETNWRGEFSPSAEDTEATDWEAV
jgi:hypothetical protein